MAGLEATLRITAKDDAGAAFDQIKKQIGALDKEISNFDKMAASVGKIGAAADPMILSIAKAQKALIEQKVAVTDLGESLVGMKAGTEAAAMAQESLGAAASRTTGLLYAQGAEAERIGGQIAAAQQRAAGAAKRAKEEAERPGMLRQGADLLPFAGPEILHETVKAIEAGASVQDEIARLTTAGANPEEIARARQDFGEFSKTHAGVLETEYLAGYRDARVIAPSSKEHPDESFEMGKLGGRYRPALRNSGLSVTEDDVGNVLRIVDELGLKSNPEREDFVNNFLKAQQAFGSQIKTETALAAYRNAKQSIYDWDPEFRNKFFPTLLQSSGQQGGTEMMTALNNYVGHHMQRTEIESLIKSGFVRPQDVKLDHGRMTFKDNAQLFEADLFKKNIARWAWDFHKSFMDRPGATEDKFGDLIAKMPRNMAGLIAFLVHNEQRIPRDAATMEPAKGLTAESNAFLAQNPSAGLDALKKSFEQFGAVMTTPAVVAAGPILVSLASGVQAIATAAEDFAKKNPKPAAALYNTALGAVGITGLALTGKLLTGIGKMFGFGGKGSAAGAEGAAAPAAEGWLATLGRLGAAVLAPASMLFGAASGNESVAAIMRRAHPEWSDDQMRAWAAGGASPAGTMIISPQRAPWPNQIQDMARSVAASGSLRNSCSARTPRSLRRPEARAPERWRVRQTPAAPEAAAHPDAELFALIERANAAHALSDEAKRGG